ncbi:MAG: large repetitive protein [Blastocatellia bacterium]
MKAIINYSKAILGVRGLALGLVFFVILMNVLPIMSRVQAAGFSGNGMMPPAMQIDINGPAGSGRFGFSVAALPNGNFVVTDPFYDITSPTLIADVGAVYLYNGATGALISKLTGSAEEEAIGIDGVTVLTNGNYVVRSSGWSDRRGAVTWCNGATGINGVVSAANSLVSDNSFDTVGSGGITVLPNGNYVVYSSSWHHSGALTWCNGATGTSGLVSPANSLVGASGDNIGGGGVTVLTNGNYVVSSPDWDSSASSLSTAGAVTWGNGATGTSGVVSPANSLVGSSSGDHVGTRVIALTNGNYLVCSPEWDNGALKDAGAVTWGNGATGTSGIVSAVNSLIGNTNMGELGFRGVAALANGNYVVGNTSWNGYRGAATWGNGTTGISGLASPANSLVGNVPGDAIGNAVTALANGNYVVSSPDWRNGATVGAGAVTWGNGATGTTGTVSAANSLVGSTLDDRVGALGATALANGNYVVHSMNWNNGAISRAGAVTWGNGTTGSSGTVSAANSLVGSTIMDQVGSLGVTALANGNYVVNSQSWHNGAIVDAGAVTWGNGTTGTSGPVSAANSLVGSRVGDLIGLDGVTALTNGNYVVNSSAWNSSAVPSVGAVTWGNGTTGTTGTVSAANSLVGSQVGEWVGLGGVTALANGNYVVRSIFWHGAMGQVGAVSWGNGATGSSGVVSPANSLVGSTTFDTVGSGGVTALINGNYVVSSPRWDNGAIKDAGAITFGLGNSGLTAGPITVANSVLGTVAFRGANLVFAYDSVNRQLVVGQPYSNIVTLFRVREFDVCLQDDSNPNTSVAFDTQTGDYLFCAGGAQYSGTGRVTRRGNTTTLQHNAGDRRVQVSLDTSANRATGSFQKLGAGGGLFSLTDRDISNDTCPCLLH